MIKGIASHIAISLFFSSFFILIVYFFFGDTISHSIFLINRSITIENRGEEKQISFDPVKKRLINYPSYGEVWATIEIPKIEVNAIVYHGDEMKLLKTGVGHFSGSYFPGEGGTVLLAAHNSSEHFGKLPSLVAGDNIILHTDYGTYTYQVTAQQVMKATELEQTEIKDNHEELILYTCYPVGTVGFKSQRYVIWANLVEETHEN